MPGAWNHVLDNPPPTSVVLFPICFFFAVRFVCFGMIRCMIINISYIFLRALFPKESIFQLQVVRLLGCPGYYTVTCRCVCTCFWTCHKWSCRRTISSSGGKGRSRWGDTRINRFAGAYPPNTWSTRGSLRSLVHRGHVSPNNVLEIELKYEHAWQGLRAPW